MASLMISSTGISKIFKLERCSMIKDTLDGWIPRPAMTASSAKRKKYESILSDLNLRKTGFETSNKWRY